MIITASRCRDSASVFSATSKGPPDGGPFSWHGKTIRPVMSTTISRSPKATVLFKLDRRYSSSSRWIAPRRSSAAPETILRAMQASYRNMQAQVDQAKKDVDFATVNFKRQQQLIANNFTPQGDATTPRKQHPAERAAEARVAAAAAGRHRRQPERRSRRADRKSSRATRTRWPRATRRRASSRTRSCTLPSPAS